MTYWSTKTSGRAGELVVIKHLVPGVNYSINGVRFRDGFAVVERGSKTYNELKKVPQLKNAPEYDLLYLGKLNFITRSKDIEYVYGKDVYVKYLKLLEIAKTKEKEEQIKVEEEVKQQEEIQHLEDSTRCNYRLPNGELCSNTAFEYSPSTYCNIHLLKDELLEGVGITVPKFILKSEKKLVRAKIMKQLEKRFKENKKLETADGTS